ncbi:cytochrome P450 6l1-like [Photinus pyralis]|uniref:cytochrome P450 6l1-like n=1 Tax=Photinus pyralis TaxID=7054 RepID=UPI00126748E2|nr:cytochrome P450 6l1-like [Photinus pyralis]
MAGRRMLSQSLWRSLCVLSYYYIPMFIKVFRFKFLEPFAVEFLTDVFQKTITERESSQTRRGDFIDMLIKLRNEAPGPGKFDDCSLIAQAVTFFSAGFESSASTLAFTLHELAVHGDIQCRLRAEVEDVIRERGGLDYEAVNDMHYLEAVVAVPETGLLIEKGTPIVIAQYGLHYNSTFFHNPDRFEPERFNRANLSNIKPCTYLPFGDGLRNCIGQMFGLLIVKIGIIQILRNYEVIMNEKSVEPVILSPFPIIQAKYNLNLTFHRLNTD